MLANSGTAQGVLAGCDAGAAAEPASGLTVYANAFLILMVPHAVVTVSLATAVLPGSRRALPTATSPDWRARWAAPCASRWR